MISNSSTKSPAASAEAWRAPRGAISRRRRGSSRAPPGCVPRRRTCARCGRARCLRRQTVPPLAHRPAYRHWRARRGGAPCRPSHQVAKSPDELAARIMATLPAITWPVEPSMVMESPFLKVLTAGGHRPARIVDPQGAGAGNAWLAHAARDHSGVRRHAAARRQDALGGVHAVDVFRRSLDAHQDDLLAVGS